MGFQPAALDSDGRNVKHALRLSGCAQRAANLQESSLQRLSGIQVLRNGSSRPDRPVAAFTRIELMSSVQPDR
jgi:hypothetical protein